MSETREEFIRNLKDKTKTIEEKVLNGEKLTEEELDYLSCGIAGHFIEEIEGNYYYGKKEMSVIFEIQGRYFHLDFIEEITDRQRVEFNKQPYEVVKKEKTIVVNEWVAKE